MPQNLKLMRKRKSKELQEKKDEIISLCNSKEGFGTHALKN